MRLRAAASFYWPSKAGDIRRKAESCPTCQLTRRHRNASGVGRASQGLDKFHTWDIDLWFPSLRNKGEAVLTAKDRATAYLVAVPLMSKDAAVTASAFLNHVIYRFGSPVSVQSDHGKEFQGPHWNALADRFAFNLLHNPLGSHDATGGIEKVHDVLETRIERAQLDAERAGEPPPAWQDSLADAVYQHNVTPTVGTNVTPHLAMYGREPRDPLLAKLEEDQDADETVSLADGVEKTAQRSNDAMEVLAEARRKTHKQAEKRMGPRTQVYKQGELVLVAYTNGRRFGPFEVAHQDPATLAVEVQSTSPDGIVVRQKPRDRKFIYDFKLPPGQTKEQALAKARLPPSVLKRAKRLREEADKEQARDSRRLRAAAKSAVLRLETDSAHSQSAGREVEQPDSEPIVDDEEFVPAPHVRRAMAKAAPAEDRSRDGPASLRRSARGSRPKDLGDDWAV
jgi:hypothetical protein